jgi:tetrahedral aminopeptidase
VEEKKITDILFDLSAAAGVSGAEDEVIRIAGSFFKEYTDQISKDRFGNLLALKKGESTSSPGHMTIALVAHIDEIGVMVTKIDTGGFLRFAPVGGIDARTLPGQPVEVYGKNKLKGVIGAAPPHLLTEKQLTETLPIDKLFIDLGLAEKEVRKLVSVGDVVSFEQKPLALSAGKKVTGKALDNRAGVAALIICAAEMAAMRHEADICFVASLQEEVGLRGAITSAYGLKPDLAVVVDVTHGEAPGLDNQKTFKVGGGPAVAFGPNLHPYLSRKLEEIAKDNYLPCQREPIPGHSGTDAWALQVSQEGIPTGLLSIPLRYMHTIVELISLEDLNLCGRLLSRFIPRVDGKLMEELKKC